MCIVLHLAWLRCGHCRRTFYRPASFGRHLQASSVCKQQILTLPSKKTRNRPSINVRCQVLRDLIKLERDNTPCAQRTVRCMYPQFSKSQISKWSSNRQELFRWQLLGHGSKRNVLRVTKAHYQRETDILYMRFVFRRNILGLKTSDKWLMMHMKKVLAEHMPLDWYKFTSSNGWLYNFKAI